VISRKIKLKTRLWWKCQSFMTLIILMLLTLHSPYVIAGDGPWPAFTATQLNGEKVESNMLIGQPTLLILTPSRDAAESSRAWVNALRSKIDQSKYRIRDVLAVNLPFFLSEEDVIDQAKKKVPKRYHDQTWILNSQVMETALDVPADSEMAVIIVLDKNGNMAAKIHGAVTTARTKKIMDALQSLPAD